MDLAAPVHQRWKKKKMEKMEKYSNLLNPLKPVEYKSNDNIDCSSYAINSHKRL